MHHVHRLVFTQDFESFLMQYTYHHNSICRYEKCVYIPNCKLR